MKQKTYKITVDREMWWHSIPTEAEAIKECEKIKEQWGLKPHYEPENKEQ